MFWRIVHLNRFDSLCVSSSLNVLYNEAAVFRLSVTRIIFSVLGNIASDVCFSIFAKSTAIRVCVTTVSLLLTKCFEIINSSATPSRIYTESAFCGHLGMNERWFSSISCLFVLSMQTTGHNGSYGHWYTSRTSSKAATNSALAFEIHHSFTSHT